MISKLSSILKDCDLSILKTALIHQSRTPDGVKLDKRLKNGIKSAKSSSNLLCLMEDVPSCNWLDTRLIGALARGCGSKSAVNLLEAYKSYVFSKKLSDALPSFVKQPQTNAYITEVSKKFKRDPDKITINDILRYQWTIKNVILNLGNQNLNIKHVKKGCLEVSSHIPIHCSINAYKMALYNRHNLHSIDLIHIKIGNHPLIYDPWFCDLRKHSVKEIIHIEYKGNFLLYYHEFVCNKVYSFYRIE